MKDNDSNSRNIGYPSQLAILLGLTGAGLVIGSVVSVMIWMMMTNRPILSIESDMVNPLYYNAILVLQAVSTLFIFFLPAYFFALICYRKPYRYLGFRSNFSYKQFLLVAAISVLTIFLIGLLAYINEIVPIPKNWAVYFKSLELKRVTEEAALIQLNSFPKYLVSLFMIAFLPALFEETFFRGTLQNFLTRWFNGPWAAIILTGIIFSVVHLSYYGFLVRFGLGVALGLIFYYGRSIWLNIFCHFLFNGIQVTVLYIITIRGIKEEKDPTTDFPLWIGVTALLLVIWLFMKFKKQSDKEQLKHTEPPQEDDLSWLTNQTK